MERKYYVTMTDRCLSGWGGADGKISKFVIVCNTMQQAHQAIYRAKQRSDMKYINLCLKKPYYNSSRYHVSFRDIEDAPYFQ